MRAEPFLGLPSYPYGYRNKFLKTIITFSLMSVVARPLSRPAIPTQQRRPNLRRHCERLTTAFARLERIDPKTSCARFALNWFYRIARFGRFQPHLGITLLTGDQQFGHIAIHG